LLLEQCGHERTASGILKELLQLATRLSVETAGRFRLRRKRTSHANRVAATQEIFKVCRWTKPMSGMALWAPTSVPC
jgi:hypothetical protein